MPDTELLGCAEESWLATWPQQGRVKLDGVFRVSEMQRVMSIVSRHFWSASIVRQVLGDLAKGSVGNGWAGVNAARTY